MKEESLEKKITKSSPVKRIGRVIGLAGGIATIGIGGVSLDYALTQSYLNNRPVIDKWVGVIGDKAVKYGILGLAVGLTAYTGLMFVEGFYNSYKQK